MGCVQDDGGLLWFFDIQRENRLVPSLESETRTKRVSVAVTRRMVPQFAASHMLIERIGILRWRILSSIESKKTAAGDAVGGARRNYPAGPGTLGCLAELARSITSGGGDRRKRAPMNARLFPCRGCVGNRPSAT